MRLILPFDEVNPSITSLFYTIGLKKTISQKLEYILQVLDNFTCDIMKLPKKPIQFYRAIVDQALKDIPNEKLPIRCSDVKRKTFHGKEEQWQKNYDVKENFIMKLVNSICSIRREYSKLHPEWYDDYIISDLMNSLIKNISKIYDETTCKHIFQYIAEQTKIIR